MKTVWSVFALLILAVVAGIGFTLGEEHQRNYTAAAQRQTDEAINVANKWQRIAGEFESVADRNLHTANTCIASLERMIAPK